jgi:signal transduction histidine kinase
MARGLEVIGRNARAQLVVVEALLDMSRMTMDKVVLDQVRVNLSDVVRDSVEALLPVAAERSLAIDVQLPSSAPHVRGDALRLQQIFWNILTNAVKFTPNGGRVTVKVSRDDHSAIVDIEDTGVGIDPAFLTRVFEPFTQQDQSLTRVVQGLGLGLAIAQHLVQLHNGTITAHSEGRGRGARFRVTLPLG